MSTALATQNGNLAVPQADFTAQQIELIEHMIGFKPGSPEFDLFINTARAKRLDPLTKQIYCIKPRNGGLQIFASIDGLRVIAERTDKYGGQTEPYWCGPDGIWRDVWLDEKPPSAAKVGVWKKGYEHPTWGVATFKSYGTGKQNNWVTMPDVMLAKCAEALALRKAFPDDLSALYVREEFAEDETPAAPSRPVQGNVARPAATPVPAEVVDAETGEIQQRREPVEVARPSANDPRAKAAQRKLELGAGVRELRERLGWDEQRVREEAERQQLSLGSVVGLEGMIAVLSGYVLAMEDLDDSEDDDEEDYEGIEAAQGTLLEAETKPIEREY